MSADLTAGTATVGEVLEMIDVIVEGGVDDRVSARWYLADHWQGLTADERERVQRQLAEWLGSAAGADHLLASGGWE